MDIVGTDNVVAPSSARTAWLSCAAVVVVCLAVGLPTVRSDNYFLGDDFGLVHHLHDLPPARLLSYFASDWTESIYGYPLDELRPVLASTYWLDAHLFGPIGASGYHVTNVVLHLLNALVVLAIARSIAPGEPAFAVLAASLFALMPSHAEPIGWISGRVDSLASLFYLGAFLCFVRFRLGTRGHPAWLFAALLIFTCGLFAKQSIVTFPALVLAFDVLGPESRGLRGLSLGRLWPHVLFFTIALLYLLLRHALFGNAVREGWLTPATIVGFVYRQFRYVREMLPAPDGGTSTIRLVARVLGVGAFAVCVSWALAGGQAYRHVAQRVLFFGAAWYAITIAPMIVTYYSPRHLYITAAGVSIALASVILPGHALEGERRRRIRMAIVGVLIALYAVAAIWNVSKWVTRGIDSQKFATAVPRLLQTLPRGSVVLVNVPEQLRNGWFWSWATPFALQPPFTSEDLDKQFRVVEPPPVYCCPADQWWAAKKDALMPLIDAPSPQEVAYIAFAPEHPEAAVLSRRTIDGRAFKHLVETRLSKPFDSLRGGITEDEGREIGRILFQ